MLAILVFILISLCATLRRGLSVLHPDRQSSYTVYRVNIWGLQATKTNRQTGKDKVTQQVVNLENHLLKAHGTSKCNILMKIINVISKYIAETLSSYHNDTRGSVVVLVLKDRW